MSLVGWLWPGSWWQRGDSSLCTPTPLVIAFGQCLDGNGGMAMGMGTDCAEGGRVDPSHERCWGLVIMGGRKAALREKSTVLITILQWTLGIS